MLLVLRLLLTGTIEHVAGRSNRSDKICATGRAKRLAQSTDMDIDRLGVDETTLGPTSFDELYATARLLAVLHQELKQPEFDRSQVDVDAETLDAVPVGIQFDSCIGEDATVARHGTRRVWKEDTVAKEAEQLGGSDRSYKILVNTGLQQIDKPTFRTRSNQSDRRDPECPRLLL